MDLRRLASLSRIDHIVSTRIATPICRRLCATIRGFKRPQPFTPTRPISLPGPFSAPLALGVTLFFTLPSTGQLRTVVPDDPFGDSIRVECMGGPLIRGLKTAYLWGQTLRGGGFTVVDSHSVIGLEGKPDSFVVNVSGNYYVTTRNGVGMSCAPGKPVTVLLETILTDVPASAASSAGAVVAWELFNARGARVSDFGASGVYFAKIVRASGRVEGRKVPYIRGRGPLVNVREWYVHRLRAKRG